jgi:RNA polymerase sigma-70 factor (ECF subfamily)
MGDRELAERLRHGDETAFRQLVAEYGGRLSRLARAFSRNDSVIEEAVQETWLAVIRGIHGFEGRSSLRAWIFGILVNQARRLAVREHRYLHMAGGSDPGAGSDPDPVPGDEPEPGMGRNGMWEDPPVPWGLENPESALLSRETLGVVEQAIAALPETQGQVVLLRDVEGVGAAEVCNILGISDTNQRVLLHRGRARVRRALDRYLTQGVMGPRSGARRERPSR